MVGFTGGRDFKRDRLIDNAISDRLVPVNPLESWKPSDSLWLLDLLVARRAGDDKRMDRYPTWTLSFRNIGSCRENASRSDSPRSAQLGQIRVPITIATQGLGFTTERSIQSHQTVSRNSPAHFLLIA